MIILRFLELCGTANTRNLIYLTVENNDEWCASAKYCMLGLKESNVLVSI